MSIGTITLTNNSATVTGSGTAFTSELTVDDFIVVTVGGIPYTLPIKTVNSNTSLTLVSNFTGPTQSGAAWSAVPRVALNMVTAALVAQSAEALRGLNYDKQNWQQVYSAAGNITVKLPDGSSFSGPSWKSIANKLSSLENGTITTDTRVTGNISGVVTYGDTSSAGTTIRSSEVGSFFNGWGAAAGRPGAGVYLNAYNVIGGALGATLNLVSAWGRDKTWTFSDNGNVTAPGNWVSNSDRRIKTNIAEVTDPLVKMTTIRGVTWERLDEVAPGIGFIAQDVQKCFPNSVFVGQDRTLDDGKVVEGVLSVDTSGVAAALHHESILQLMWIMKEAITTIAGVTSDESAKAALEALAERIPANNPS